MYWFGGGVVVGGGGSGEGGGGVNWITTGCGSAGGNGNEGKNDGGGDVAEEYVCFVNCVCKIRET